MPEKFNAVSIDDHYIEPLLNGFSGIKVFSHTLKRPIDGIEYAGVTLIPPQSVVNFISSFEAQNNAAYHEIIALFKKAKDNQKYIIHYGL